MYLSYTDFPKVLNNLCDQEQALIYFKENLFDIYLYRSFFNVWKIQCAQPAENI